MSPDLHNLSGAYAVDALDDSERTSFEQHLAVCADCRAEVAELSAAAHSLGSLTEATPPPALRHSVLAGITRVRPLPPLTHEAEAPAPSEAAVPPQPPSRPDDTPGDGPEHPLEGVGTDDDDHERRSATVVPLFRRTTTWFAAAAAAVLLAVGGIALGPWGDDAGTTISAIEQVTGAPDAVTISSSQGPVTADLAYSRELGQSAITIDGLAPAPDGQTYQLWYFGTGGTITSAGLLTASGDGSGQQLLDGDANSASAVGLTLEPAGGSDQPTTDPLVVVSLA